MISVLPLADAGDMIGIIVFIVIMVISAISQMAGKKQEAPRPKPRPRPRPPVRPAQAGPGRPAQAGPGRQNPVAGELEEFLRRAAGGGQQPARRPPPVPAAKPAARPMGRPVAAEPLVAEVSDELEIVESVADHVSHSVGESRFRPPAADDSTQEDHVSRKFDHQMGQFDSSPEKEAHAAALAESESQAAKVVESMPSTAAAGLAAMLSSPTSLRQAILLKEILERPEHRWS